MLKDLAGFIILFGMIFAIFLFIAQSMFTELAMFKDYWAGAKTLF
jgi:hypothetical protein